MAFYGRGGGEGFGRMGGMGGLGGMGGGMRGQTDPLALFAYLPTRLAMYAMIANRHHRSRRQRTDNRKRQAQRQRERDYARAIADLRRAGRAQQRLTEREHTASVRSYHSYTKGVQREQHADWRRAHPRIRVAPVRSIDRYVDEEASALLQQIQHADQIQQAEQAEQAPTWKQLTQQTTSTSSSTNVWEAATAEASASDRAYADLAARTRRMSALVRAKYGTLEAPLTPVAQVARPAPAPPVPTVPTVPTVQAAAPAPAPTPPPPPAPMPTAPAAQPLPPKQYDRALLHMLDAWLENEWPGKQQTDSRRAFILQHVTMDDTADQFDAIALRLLRARATNLS